MTTLEQLEQQLKERIEALDKQRQEEAARFEKEVADRNALAEIERKRQIEEHHLREEEHRARKQKEMDAIESQRRETERKQKEAELASNAAQEAQRQQEEKLRWLREEIAKQEFIEEQHRKRLDAAKQAETSKPVDTTGEINIEHPTAPDNKGNAVKGTEGSTPETPLMSHHLKHILRQAARTY